MRERLHSCVVKYFTIVGRRGTFLILMGLAWLVIGYGVMKDNTVHQPALMHEVLPEWIRVGGWIVAGVAGIACAFTRKAMRDVVGFVLMCIPPATRAVSYAINWIEFQYGGPSFGLGTSWSGAVVWSVVVFMLMLIASWPEPEFMKRGT